MNIPRLPQEAPKVFSDADLKAIEGAIGNVRDRALFYFLLDSGVRAAEVVNVNVGDVDLNSGAVLIRRGKGGKDRVVFVGAKTRKTLVRYLAARGNPPADAPLWVRRDGGRLKREGIRTILRRWGEKTGVKNCTAHTFRRSFATRCLQGGMNFSSCKG